MIKPSKVIGRGYLYMWHLIPRNRFFNIYLHKFGKSDDDRALHDHPWWSVSILLRGGYIEHFKDCYKARRVFSIFGRKATTAHRIELIGSSPVWTLFITGPVVREWGFHCPKGWRHWKDFTSFYETGDSSEVGPGCD